ncbi:hypothetical protein [Shinella sp.]|uniref:hypothetical protein n=1 Tax=Shinella sp. TaxID=1870904 RepID=UPI003D2A43B2
MVVRPGQNPLEHFLPMVYRMEDGSGSGLHFGGHLGKASPTSKDHALEEVPPPRKDRQSFTKAELTALREPLLCCTKSDDDWRHEYGIDIDDPYKRMVNQLAIFIGEGNFARAPLFCEHFPKTYRHIVPRNVANWINHMVDACLISKSHGGYENGSSDGLANIPANMEVLFFTSFQKVRLLAARGIIDPPTIRADGKKIYKISTLTNQRDPRLADS